MNTTWVAGPPAADLRPAGTVTSPTAPFCQPAPQRNSSASSSGSHSCTEQNSKPSVSRTRSAAAAQPLTALV